jgi:hypothetical protein
MPEEKPGPPVIPPVHQHHWEAIGTDYPPTSAHPRAVNQRLTYVLLRCDCGEVKSLDLDGHWTIDQIKGVMPDASPS